MVCVGTSGGAPMLGIPVLRSQIKVPPYCGPDAAAEVFTGTADDAGAAADVAGAAAGEVVVEVAELHPATMNAQIRRIAIGTYNLFIATS